MSGRAWMVAVAALSVAAPAGAEDTARRRDGASRDRSSAAAERRQGGRSGGEGSVRGRDASSQSERGRSTARGDDRSATRRVTGAEARHPEAGTGRGWRAGRYGYYASRPYYYSSRSYYWYRPYYYGWYGVPYYDFYDGGWGYPYASGYSGQRYAYRDTASVRTLVDPERTKVLVDGYYAGVVDDFDGMFQRLHVSPGRHEISFELEGYRTHRVRVYAAVDHTLKIRHEMEKGSGEATVEDLTEGRETPPYRASREADDEGYSASDRDRYPPPDYGRAGSEREARETGTLRVDVRPDDASIYVDGEFYGTARRATSLTLAPGRHRVEVVRPGYRTVEREVEVRPGRAETVSIDLERS